MTGIREKISFDCFKAFNYYSLNFVSGNIIRIVYNEYVIINEYITNKEMSPFETAFIITKTEKEIFEEKKEEFKKKALERIKKAKFLKNKLIDFRLAEMKDINYNDRILRFDVKGFNRDLILRAYIVITVEIDKDKLILENL